MKGSTDAVRLALFLFHAKVENDITFHRVHVIDARSIRNTGSSAAWPIATSSAAPLVAKIAKTLSKITVLQES
jgi:hypothetical protein